VRDVTSGFRAYRAELLRSIDLATVDTTGYGFQIDMTDRARGRHAQIREVPIVFRDRTAGESKMSGPIVREALLLVTRRAVDNLRGHRYDRAVDTATIDTATVDAASVDAGGTRTAVPAELGDWDPTRARSTSGRHN
jgi:dolichol-phosphate mannosyltransferase